MSVTAEASRSHRELSIALDRETFARTGKLAISGKLGIFVNCGSQLSIWGSFPRDIQFKVTDLQTGKQHLSGRGPESISYAQVTIESYARNPCDQVVEKAFTVDFDRKIWLPPLPEMLGAIKIEAEYLGINSNQLSVP